jgi:hypothetical protein
MNNFMNNYSQQSMYEQIDYEINKLNQMKNQLQNNNQQPAINQTFQLAPNSNGIKYANNIEEVQKEMVINDTPFFSKDMSILWIKNTNNEIKAYELIEIVEKDEKDIQIELLQAQINEMKGMINNAKSNDVVVDEPVKNEKSTNVQFSKSSTKKQK